MRHKGMDNKIDAQELLTAHGIFGKVSQNLAIKEQNEAVAMAFSIEAVRLFLGEFATYLINGDDQSDALMKAAKGELKV